jgi:all-trans-retinol 13,14-reductase
MIENHYDTIIIGSGLGSLLCGYILSREGMRVCILEKNSKPGGALQTFKRKGVSFNTGIHYIGGMEESQNLNRYFKYFGLTGKLKLSRLNKDRFDVIAFDNAEYPLAQGFDNFIEQLLPYFPDEKKSLRSYIDKLEEISKSFSLYNLEIPKRNHKEEFFRNQSAYEYYNSLPNSEVVIASEAKQKHPASSIQHRVSLSSILAGNNFLYAGSKYKTPLHIPALINHSFISSSWKPDNGSQQIADLLIESIKNFGGVVRTNCEVSEILHHVNGFTIVIKTKEQFTCNRLISGIHPLRTIDLMNPSLFRKVFSSRIRNLENTTGSFALYIVLKKKSFNYLDHNFYYHTTGNVWYERERDQWPTGYMLHTPSCEETSNFAKNLVIMTYMDFNDVKKWENSVTGKRDADYYIFKEEKANQLINLAEKRFPGLRSGIACIESSTPLTWRDFTGTPGGSMYGIKKDYNDPTGTVVFPNTRIPGFFFTGQNINLHGVLGVTIGSVMTCSEILGVGYLIKKIRNG